MPVQNRRRAYLITVVLYGGRKLFPKNINNNLLSILLISPAPPLEGGEEKHQQTIAIIHPANSC